MKVLIWSMLSGAKIVLFLIIDGLDAQNLTDLLHLPIFIVRLVKGVKKTARYIDAVELIKAIEENQRNTEHHKDGRGKQIHVSEHRHFIKMIYEQPTADVQEVRYCKFELVQDGKGVCSNCHRLDSIDKLAKYCRYCGAFIKLEDDSNG